MARIRNMHCLIGSRNFSIPTHKQRFMFFHPEDVKNGTMDKWMKSVQINQWEQHDNEDCTVFHFSLCWGIQIASSVYLMMQVFYW